MPGGRWWQLYFEGREVKMRWRISIYNTRKRYNGSPVRAEGWADILVSCGGGGGGGGGWHEIV